MATKKTAAKSPAKAAANKTVPAKAAATTETTTPAPAKKAAAKKTAVKQPAAKKLATHEEISTRAHQYFAERGHQHGSHVADWLRAEKDLNS